MEIAAQQHILLHPQKQNNKETNQPRFFFLSHSQFCDMENLGNFSKNFAPPKIKQNKTTKKQAAEQAHHGIGNDFYNFVILKIGPIFPKF